MSGHCSFFCFVKAGHVCGNNSQKITPNVYPDDLGKCTCDHQAFRLKISYQWFIHYFYITHFQKYELQEYSINTKCHFLELEQALPDLALSSNKVLPRWYRGKESACNTGDAREVSSIPGSGRFPGAGNAKLLRHPCLEKSMEIGAWWATVHGVTKSWMRLSTAQHSSIQEGTPGG